MKKSILLIITIAFTNILVAQNPIYIEISDCAKKLTYTYNETDGTTYKYHDYHFAINEYETAILKTSNNTPTIANTINNVINCNDLQSTLSVEVIEQIQKAKQEVYLVKANENGYAVMKAFDAAYQVYLPKDKYLRVATSQYSFDYDGSQVYDPGASLKKEGEGDFILFNEQEIDCYEKPTFMHVPVNFMETSNIEYILGIGVVRQHSDEMEHQLTSIDNQPFQEYLATFCHPEVVVEKPIIKEEVVITSKPKTKKSKTVVEKPVLNVPSFEEEPVVIEEDVDKSLIEEDVAEVIENSTGAAKGETTIMFKSQPVTRPAIITNKNTHVVMEGETLYSISKKYGLSTLQLKTLNQLGDNTIEIGQKLKVKE